jgi:hypothetical protein
MGEAHSLEIIDDACDDEGFYGATYSCRKCKKRRTFRRLRYGWCGALDHVQNHLWKDCPGPTGAEQGALL